MFVEGQLFSDDFTPKGGTKTSGRIRVDNANVKLLRRARRNDEEVEKDTSEDELMCV